MHQIITEYRRQHFSSLRSEITALNALLDSGEPFTATERRFLWRRWNKLHELLLNPSGRFQVLGVRKGRTPGRYRNVIKFYDAIRSIRNILD